jgi:hypothetical protein
MKRPPKAGKADIAIKVAEAVVSAIPGVGGPLATLSELFEGPISRRRQRWLEELAETVSELQRRVDELSEPLDENEAFITAVFQASQIAIRTHQQDKIEALRNAVKNSALRHAPDENLQLMFLRFVDEFTPLHLRVLAVFDNPGDWVAKTGRRFQISMGGLGTVITHCVPELVHQNDLSNQIYRDLQNRGLLEQGAGLNVAMSQQGLLSRRTSALGKESEIHQLI